MSTFSQSSSQSFSRAFSKLPSIWHLAWPLILSNITVPLLGLVDTAVLGHLDSHIYLAAATIGANLFSVIYFNFGFLRMSSTGFIAQQKLSSDTGREAIHFVILRGCCLALLLAAGLIIFQDWIFGFGIQLIGGTTQAQVLALEYCQARIWGAPAALINLVIVGALLGLGKPKQTFLLLFITNGTNIVLDYWFVYGLNLGVKGVAWATVIANYVSLVAGIILIFKQTNPLLVSRWRKVFEPPTLKKFFQVNSDIFLRTLFLMTVFLQFIHLGAQQGDAILAANSVLLTFFFILSNALDGFANAAEISVGQSIRDKNFLEFNSAVAASAIFSIFIALCLSLLFFFFGELIIDLLTDLSHIQELAKTYLPWIWVLPFTTIICFLLDGVFIGATETRAMRNAMVFSTFLIFMPLCFLILPKGNHELWLALNIFMVARSISMSWYFFQLKKKIQQNFLI